MKSEVARWISSWYLLALPWGAARELALETALEMVALPGGGEGARDGDRLGDGVDAAVWSPNHNHRPEHYDVQRIVAWVFGWGSPSYMMSTKTKRHE